MAQPATEVSMYITFSNSKISIVSPFMFSAIAI